MHSDILVFTPQQHTIHVVVSYTFTIWVVLPITVALLSLSLLTLSLRDLTDHMNVSLGKFSLDSHKESFMFAS